MPKFMFKGKYVGKGIEGLLEEGGTGRREAVEKLAASMGGKLEAFYYAFGEWDVYSICDLPDNEAAIDLTLAVNATGVVSVGTTVLLTPEEIDEAVERHPKYRAPGD